MEVCRGEHTFSGGCRGDRDSMSWDTGMSWRYVVGNIHFSGDVVGTALVCRGEQVCRGGMSWRTYVFLGDVVGTAIVCRGEQGCRGSMSWGTGMSWKHVVGDKLVVEVGSGDVVGTMIVCRESMS